MITKEILIETGMKFEPRFILDDSCVKIYEDLLLYFNNSPDFESIRPGYSLSKGILLKGRIGSGKSLLFKIFGEILRQTKLKSNSYEKEDGKHYYRETANKIVQLYSLHGYNIFNAADKYGENESYSLSNNNLFIDDIGSEPHAQYYGKYTNIIEELLLHRYEGKYLTFVTTNLDAQSLKEFYGERVLSRMKEMFNDMTMEGGDRRN